MATYFIVYVCLTYNTPKIILHKTMNEAPMFKLELKHLLPIFKRRIFYRK